MNISDFIITFLTTRELATITIIVVTFMLLSMKNRDVRESGVNLIKIFFHWKIMLTILIAQIYCAAFTYIFYRIGLWNVTILRESIYFSLYTSILLIFKYNNKYERLISIKVIITDSVKLTFIIGFYFNLYTFSYLGELFLQFFLALFFLLGAYNQKENIEEEKVYGFTQIILTCLMLFQIAYCIYATIKSWDDVFSTDNIISLLFPMVATVIYWPFLYIYSVIVAYEVWFVRVNSSSNWNRDVYLYRRNKILRACKLNLRKIIFVSKDFHIYIPQTQMQFVEDLQKSILKYKKKYNHI